MRPCLTLAAAAALLAAGAPASRAPDVPERKLVFYGEKEPVLLGLRVLVDGKPLDEAHRAAWDEYVRRLFAHLDRNGDGWLDEREASAAPPPILPSGVGGQARFAFNFAVLDSNSDGRVSLEELAEYYRQFGDAPFQVRALGPGPPTDALSAALIRLADKDGDGKLSKEELAGLEAAVMARDRDGDELISGDELVETPRLRPGMFPQIPRAEFQYVSVVPVLPIDGVSRLAGALKNRYGEGDWERYLARPADVVLTVRLGDRAANGPAVEVTGAARATPTADGVLLEFPGARLEIQALRDRVGVVAAGHQAALVRRFGALSAGRQGPLSLKAVQSDRWLTSLFPLLDRDGRGAADDPRVRAFAENVLGPQIRAQMGRAELIAPGAGRGLFHLLDRNRDGRLSRRELRAAPALLAPYFRDGFLSLEALPVSHHVVLRLVPYDPTNELAEEPGLPLYGAEAAPLWFRKMDRNGDGDISPKEFLGTREQFRRLDRDGDGLISLEEALWAEKER